MLSVFTAHAQTCFARYQIFAVCKMLLQKVESSSTFCDKICTCCAFYLPKSNFFCTASDVTPVCWRDSRLILSNQKSVFKQLCCLTGLNMGGKTRYIAFNSFVQQCYETSCTILLPVTQISHLL